MGQKVGGYRRNVPYGKETRLLSQGWTFDVNPTGMVGWNRGTSGRKEDEYGESVNESRRLRKELEEVRKLYGCESNGLGRKGTKRRGYTVYGEYRSGATNSNLTGTSYASVANAANVTKESNPLKSKGYKTRSDRNELNVALERVVISYEKKRKCKVDRKRKNLKERRKEKGIETVLNEKEERKSVLGYSSKRRKAEERCETLALSGVLPVTQRRTNLIVRELEGNLNHMEILRNRESLRTHHARSSQYGRKRLGEVQGVMNQNGDVEQKGMEIKKGGYYGFNVSVKGPLEGSRRTLAYVIQRGTVPRGTKRARIMISHEHAKTTYGTIGVRVTYCYGRG
jgi:hypothetical protein